MDADPTHEIHAFLLGARHLHGQPLALDSGKRLGLLGVQLDFLPQAALVSQDELFDRLKVSLPLDAWRFGNDQKRHLRLVRHESQGRIWVDLLRVNLAPGACRALQLKIEIIKAKPLGLCDRVGNRTFVLVAVAQDEYQRRDDTGTNQEPGDEKRRRAARENSHELPFSRLARTEPVGGSAIAEGRQSGLRRDRTPYLRPREVSGVDSVACKPIRQSTRDQFRGCLVEARC
jgi:hypothetical protein